jgi:hypothetical protein
VVRMDVGGIPEIVSYIVHDVKDTQEDEKGNG